MFNTQVSDFNSNYFVHSTKFFLESYFKKIESNLIVSQELYNFLTFRFEKFLKNTFFHNLPELKTTLSRNIEEAGTLMGPFVEVHLNMLISSFEKYLENNTQEEQKLCAKVKSNLMVD